MTEIIQRITDLTPSKSRTIQAILFKKGYVWTGGRIRKLRHISSKTISLWSDYTLSYYSGEFTHGADYPSTTADAFIFLHKLKDN